MRSDIKAIKAWNHLKSAGTTGTEDIDWDCEYVEYSTVPDHTGGPFWSILNRLFIRMSPFLSFHLLPWGGQETDSSVRMPTSHLVGDWIPTTIWRVPTDPRSSPWSRMLGCLPSSVRYQLRIPMGWGSWYPGSEHKSSLTTASSSLRSQVGYYSS